MAFPITPSRRTRQPLTFVDSRFGGLFFNPAATSAAIVRSAGINGVQANLTATPAQYFYLPVSINGRQNLTFAALVYVANTTVSLHRGLIGTRIGTSDVAYIQIAHRSDNNWAAQCKVKSGDTETFTDSGGTVTVGWHFIALTVGVDCKFYVDRAAPVVFPRSSTSALAGHPTPGIGMYYDGETETARRFVGNVAGALVAPVALLEGDIRQLADNFWYAAKDESRRIYFGASGGAGFADLGRPKGTMRPTVRV